MPNTKAKLDRLRQKLGAAKDVRPEGVDQSQQIEPYSIPAEDQEQFSNIASQEDVLRTQAILDESPGAEQAPIPQEPTQPTPTQSSTESQPPSVQPPSLDEVVGNSGSKVNNEIVVAESEGGELGDALKEYNKVVNVAMDEYRKEKKALKQRELWDGIIKGVGLMTAGLYGLKTGTDMGGVKVNTTDWASNLRNAQAELQSALGQAGRSFNMKKGVGEAVTKRNQQMWDRSFKIAKEKRLAEESMMDLAAKTSAAGAKQRAAGAKIDDKKAGAEAKEINRLEKEITSRIDKYANPKADEDQKELYKRQIEQLNEKYRNLTGKDMASTKKLPKWWGLSDRDPTPAEMLDTSRGSAPSPSSPEQPSGDVKMISPDGKTYIIPSENVQKALSGGWTKA